MSNYKNLPAPSPENGLNRYLQEIRKFPMLEPGQEYMLAKRWIEEQDADRYDGREQKIAVLTHGRNDPLRF